MQRIHRREFLKRTGLAAGVGMAEAMAAAKEPGVSIVLAPNDPIASSAPARWAAGELQQALSARGVSARIHDKVEGPGSILAAGAANPNVHGILKAAGAPLPEGPESLVLASAKGNANTKGVVVACGSDARGLVYALLELADRVRHAGEPLAALEVRAPVAERPANAIRSVARCFESDVEDKPWFYDRAMWRAYLSMLAAQRFNRFSLTLGLGYNFPRNVRDVYFYFAYPYLVSVPGYKVRASGVSDAERDRNLETLRFIGEETVARGLQFQLALWTHAYQWVDSPHAHSTIEGLTPDNHAAYCRDALLEVLKTCPAISGVTFRVHGESGVPEGSYSFWQTLFEGIVRCGRLVEIDMHAKGMDQKMIDVALATGMPVNISPKYWAEHMGLPYHQAAIRELERAGREQTEGPFTLSGGSRRFTRYGYGDLLRQDRRYGILHRIWPGTQRVLLWGDPALAAGYGRLSSFCGSVGVELCEPLSFKGRMGSGVAGGRCAYADSSLNPKYDWEKYLYTYRLWGRLIYNPDADAETWQRRLRKEFQAGAPAAEAALANASRILPLVTTTHGVSGSNNTYWPEIYTNMPIVDPDRPHPYRDTPSPRRFGAVSPFDPQLFSRADDFAQELWEGKRSGKYSPPEVAQWLEDFAGEAASQLKEAESRVAARSPEFRRWAADVAIQSGLGRFFAWKLRSAALWALYEKSDAPPALEEALKAYRAARSAWAELADRAKGVYAADITYGMTPHMRGHWLDRLPAIDQDIADMEKRLQQVKTNGPGAADQERVRRAIREVLARPRRPSVAFRHTPPARFRPGAPLPIELASDKANRMAVRLHYRHTNQAELWRTEEMKWRDNRFAAVIPADYTQSPYALQYYFELRDGDSAWLYPGLLPTLANQPYFVARAA